MNEAGQILNGPAANIFDRKQQESLVDSSKSRQTGFGGDVDQERGHSAVELEPIDFDPHDINRGYRSDLVSVNKGNEREPHCIASCRDGVATVAVEDR